MKYSLARICSRAPKVDLGSEQDLVDELWQQRCCSSSKVNVDCGIVLVKCVQCDALDSMTEQNTFIVCTECGWTSAEPQSYQCPYMENTYSPQGNTAQYNKISRSKNQTKILSVHNIYSIFMNDETINKIIESTRKLVKNDSEITLRHVECGMKQAGIGLAEYSFLIYQKIHHLPPITFSSEEIKAYQYMLDTALMHFEEARRLVAPVRKNFLGKKFLVYKIFESMGRQDILPQLQTLKPQASQKPHDKIWDKIAELAKWN